MPLYDAVRLHRFMSEPQWTAAQWQEAERIARSTVHDLGSALNDAIIEPTEFDELVAVGRDGRIYTTAPVAELIAVAGQVTPGGVVPDGYTLRRRYLYRRASGALPFPGLGSRWYDQRPAPLVDQVAVHYVGGWTDEPALREAILTKAAIRMGRRHADTMNVTGLSAQPSNPVQPSHFTADELAPLGPYRRLAGAGTL